jgi:hypothetical protein
MQLERLAQFLAYYAQVDAALPLPAPANDDHPWPSFADDMFDRIGSIAGWHSEAQPIRLDPAPLAIAEAGRSQELEELVAIALTSVQDAQAVSRAARAASRLARRGALVAMGMAAVGIAIAGTAAFDARIYRAGNRAVAETASPAQNPGDVPHQAAAPLAAQPIMEATVVRVLPAEPAAREAAGEQSASSPPAARVQDRSWPIYHRPLRRYRTGWPPTAGYSFSSSVQYR